MKRFSIFSFIFNIITLLLLFMILAYNDYHRSMNLISNNFSSENSRMFSSATFTGYIHLKGFFFANSFDEYIIKEVHMVDVPSEMPTGILAKNYIPPFTISNGRFFRNSDYFNGQRVAVVGCNVAEKVNVTVDVNGFPYRVIGIIHEYASTAINNAVYYNLDSAESGAEVFIVDSDSALMADRIFDILSKTAKIKEIFPEDVSFDRFIRNRTDSREAYRLILVLGSIIQSIKVLFTVRDNAKRIKIQYTFGKMKICIFRDTALKVIAESLMALLLIFCLFFAFEHQIRLNELLPYSAALLIGAAVCEVILSPIQILNFIKNKRSIIFGKYKTTKRQES